MKITVNLGAVKQNFAAVKKRVGDAKICAMVKADAYGHGLKTVGAALAGVADYLGVASDGEAAALRAVGVSCPILITGALNYSDVKILFEKSITQTVLSTEDLKVLEHIGTVLNKKIKVHLKVDTGMNRLGVDSTDSLDNILSFLGQSKFIVCEGVFTHFATSDGSDREFLEKQHKLFENYLSRFRAKYPLPILAHCLSSGGILTASEYRHDMVRPGIMLYGYTPDKKLNNDIKLRPALMATAPVVSVKKIAAGESVSYGRDYITEEEKTVAVIRAGYGDGFKRVLSSRGFVMLSGSRAPILGRVCMDMFMVDVTNIPAKIGDEAVLIGDGISAEDMAGLAGTIPYEILTGLKTRTQICYI